MSDIQGHERDDKYPDSLWYVSCECGGIWTEGSVHYTLGFQNNGIGYQSHKPTKESTPNITSGALTIQWAKHTPLFIRPTIDNQVPNKYEE